MPELPEVETIRKGLENYLVNHIIEDIEVRLLKMVSGRREDVIGAKIIGIRRFGKGLVVDFGNDHSIAIHVKMTGQLIYDGPDRPKSASIALEKVGKTLPNTATHVIFHLDKKGILYYNDIRQFGWIKIVKTKDVADLPFFKELGPEPLKDLTPAIFTTLLQKTKAPIKPLLMDQKKISGMGNIYANDALFLAKIHPERPANSLSEQEIGELFHSIEKVLAKGLEVGGASEWQYVNVLGETGKYQNFFQVYGRVGKPCLRCRTRIQKIALAGRGTFFCPRCQI